MIKQKFDFPARLRLNKPIQFKSVFDLPTRSTDKYFTVLARKNELDFPRLGLVIAKKNIKKATNRNKIKRMIRESFRTEQHLLGAIDFVVLTRYQTGDVTVERLKVSLKKHWQKLQKNAFYTDSIN
ncbi:MAG: ribonuclease P protein component [Methylococcales bacterium]|nr:ribonuclease P protein component [Methylococcales bacterium]